jgi:two-component system, chemotaxis family, CheB/CheR fusion protein
VAPELLERYFERNGQGHVFSKDLRRSVIFGRRDLIQDAPISRVDLLVCRNTVMYLNSETQSHVLARFSFALRERLMVLTDAVDRAGGGSEPRDMRIRNAALETSPEAQLVVDAAGYLAVANGRARALFNLQPDDIARPFQDLEVSYRPLELRSKIQRVGGAGPAPGGRAPGAARASISFADVTRSRRYKEELEHANQGLEDAYAELQSTNEELETTNEEMQSTNEELQTINDELGMRTAELNQLNAFLESIRAGLGGAVVVLDPTCGCWSGTTAPRTCGASARRRSRASTCSTWTSACPWTRSGRPSGWP